MNYSIYSNDKTIYRLTDFSVPELFQVLDQKFQRDKLSQEAKMTPRDFIDSTCPRILPRPSSSRLNSKR